MSLIKNATVTDQEQQHNVTWFGFSSISRSRAPSFAMQSTSSTSTSLNEVKGFDVNLGGLE